MINPTVKPSSPRPYQSPRLEHITDFQGHIHGQTTIVGSRPAPNLSFDLDEMLKK